MKNILHSFVVLVLIVACTSKSNDNYDDPDDIASIKKITESYAKSVNDLDTALAGSVWENSNEVSFIHPMGHEKGWNSIKDNVYLKIMNGFFYERELIIKDPSIHTRNSAAWVEFNWDFKAKLRSDSSIVNTHGRESQFYIKKNDAWKLVHVHYSVMPVPGIQPEF